MTNTILSHSQADLVITLTRMYGLYHSAVDRDDDYCATAYRAKIVELCGRLGLRADDISADLMVAA